MRYGRWLAALAAWLFLLSAGLPAHAAPAAEDKDAPLFINLTSDEGHRTLMAIGYGANQVQRGHPLTLFLNDRAVVLAARGNEARYPEQQRMLAKLVGSGATVYVCPMCMKQYGVQQADLLPGLAVSTPDLTGAALFRENTRTLSW